MIMFHTSTQRRSIHPVVLAKRTIERQGVGLTHSLFDHFQADIMVRGQAVGLISGARVAYNASTQELLDRSVGEPTMAPELLNPKSPWIVKIDHLFVAPSHRGLGLGGQALRDFLQALCPADGLAMLLALPVAPLSDPTPCQTVAAVHRLVQFYQTLGFEPTHTDPSGGVWCQARLTR